MQYEAFWELWNQQNTLGEIKSRPIRMSIFTSHCVRDKGNFKAILIVSIARRMAVRFAYATRRRVIGHSIS